MIARLPAQKRPRAVVDHPNALKPDAPHPPFIGHEHDWRHMHPRLLEAIIYTCDLVQRHIGESDCRPTLVLVFDLLCNGDTFRVSETGNTAKKVSLFYNAGAGAPAHCASAHRDAACCTRTGHNIARAVVMRRLERIAGRPLDVAILE